MMNIVYNENVITKIIDFELFILYRSSKINIISELIEVLFEKNHFSFEELKLQVRIRQFRAKFEFKVWTLVPDSTNAI